MTATGGGALIVRPRLVSVIWMLIGGGDGWLATAGAPSEPGDEPCSPTNSMIRSARIAPTATASRRRRARDGFAVTGTVVVSGTSMGPWSARARASRIARPTLRPNVRR